MRSLKAVLMLCLLAPVVLGQEAQPLEAVPSDVPIIASVKSGTAVVADGEGERSVTLVPGAYINALGMQKLGKSFQGLQVDLIEAKAQNEALRTRVDEIAADPPLNLKTVLIIAGCSLLAGAGIGAGVALAVTKGK